MTIESFVHQNFKTIEGSVSSIKEAEYILIADNHSKEIYEEKCYLLAQQIGQGTLFIESRVGNPHLLNLRDLYLPNFHVKGWDLGSSRNFIDFSCAKMEEGIVLLESCLVWKKEKFEIEIYKKETIEERKKLIEKIDKVVDDHLLMAGIEKITKFSDKYPQFKLKKLDEEIILYRKLVQTISNLKKDPNLYKNVELWNQYIQQTAELWDFWLQTIRTSTSLEREECMHKQIFAEKPRPHKPCIVFAGAAHLGASKSVTPIKKARTERLKAHLKEKKYVLLKPTSLPITPNLSLNPTSLSHRITQYVKGEIFSKEGISALSLCTWFAASKVFSYTPLIEWGFYLSFVSLMGCLTYKKLPSLITPIKKPKQYAWEEIMSLDERLAVIQQACQKETPRPAST